MHSGLKTALILVGSLVAVALLLIVMVARMMPADLYSQDGTGITPGSLKADSLANATEADVPEVYQAVVNPYASDDADALEAGRTLAARRCAGCHGARLQGGRGAADLTQSAELRSEQFLFWAISEGSRQGMSAFGRTLTEEERWQLVTFIRSLEPQSGGTP